MDVLLAIIAGIVSGTLIKISKMIYGNELFILMSFFIFNAIFLVLFHINISAENVNFYKTLLLVFAISAFFTETVMDKIFLCPHDIEDIEGE